MKLKRGNSKHSECEEKEREDKSTTEKREGQKLQSEQDRTDAWGNPKRAMKTSSEAGGTSRRSQLLQQGEKKAKE
jgi:hypothetical protein